MINQTSVIMFALLVGFIVFITVKGELASYLWVLGLANSPGAGVSTGGGLPPDASAQDKADAAAGAIFRPPTVRGR